MTAGATPFDGPPHRDVDNVDVVTWLSAAHCPTPMWGRRQILEDLVEWCVNGSPDDRVRVVAGRAGTGKSRLLVELARALPPGWHAGQVTDTARVADAIEACGDPCVVVVDDADLREDIAVLVTQLMATRTRVRVLLCGRNADRIRAVALPDAVRQAMTAMTPVFLTALGGERDRRGWFADATQAYATAWRTPAPEPKPGAVGEDDDVMAVLQIRAVIAALDRAAGDTQTVRLPDLLARLWTEHAGRWAHDPDLPSPARGKAALAEIVTMGALFPASDLAGRLRRLPRFADTTAEVRTAIAEWWSTRLNDGLLPSLLVEHIVTTTVTCLPELLDSTHHVVGYLARAVRSLPDSLPVLVDALTRSPRPRTELLAQVFATAERTGPLDRAIAALIEPDLTDIPERFVHARCAWRRARVENSSDDADELTKYATSLLKVERAQEALVAAEKAVTAARAAR